MADASGFKHKTIPQDAKIAANELMEGSNFFDIKTIQKCAKLPSADTKTHHLGSQSGHSNHERDIFLNIFCAYRIKTLHIKCKISTSTMKNSNTCDNTKSPHKFYGHSKNVLKMSCSEKCYRLNWRTDSQTSSLFHAMTARIKFKSNY